MRFWTRSARTAQHFSAPTTDIQQNQHLGPPGSWIGFILASIAAALLIFSAGAQNVSYGYALGAVHSEFRAIVLAMASAGATLLAPVCFAAVVVCFRRRSFGVSLVALVLGTLALLYASTCSLGTVAGSRDIAISEYARATDSQQDRRALIEAARKELAGLKGQRADIVERRSELTALLVKLGEAKTGKGAAVRADSQARGVAFVLGALGWRATEADVGQWLNVLTVLFLELAAALSLTIAAALYPATRQTRSEGGRTATLPASVPDAPLPVDGPQRAPAEPPRASERKGDDKNDDPPAPPPPRPRGKAGRKPTVLPAQAIERLRAKGGNVTGSLNGLAKVLGTRSKAATHRLLHRLAAAGAVQLSTDRRGIAVALA